MSNVCPLCGDHQECDCGMFAYWQKIRELQASNESHLADLSTILSMFTAERSNNMAKDIIEHVKKLQELIVHAGNLGFLGSDGLRTIRQERDDYRQKLADTTEYNERIRLWLDSMAILLPLKSCLPEAK